MHALLIEDDVRLSEVMVKMLEDEGYDVDAVHDGVSGLEYAESGIYDVIICDVMLPGMNGFDIVAQLRRKKVSTPVLMLTARDAVMDKVRGFDSGADDYLTKPFAPVELFAHLRALTRRQGEVVFERLSVGNLVLNLESGTLECGSKNVALSAKELDLARVLMTNAGHVVTKSALISKVWGYDSEAVDNNVEAYISFLRKKIRFVGASAKIETLRSRGYRMIAEDQEPLEE